MEYCFVCLLVLFFVVLALGVVGRCVVGDGARVLGNLVVTSGGILLERMRTIVFTIDDVILYPGAVPQHHPTHSRLVTDSLRKGNKLS